MDNKGLAPLVGILVVAAVVAAPVVTVAASQAAIPGEALYGLKRASEAITAPSALDKLDRRLGELQALADRRPDPDLIDQSAADVRAMVLAAVNEAASAEGIERAKAVLDRAHDVVLALYQSESMPEESKPGLMTALDAIESGQVGLDTAMNQLKNLPIDGSVADVAP